MNFAGLHSALNPPPPHLSDEAIAACADSALNAPARLRAERHLAGCPDCARAVSEQREAARALRSAVAPSLPLGLMERLREVPLTTELPPRPLSLSPEGEAVFPTFRPAQSRPVEPAPADGGSAADYLQHAVRRHSRVLMVTAAAFVTISGVSVAATVGPAQVAQDAPAPSVPQHFAPAAYTSHQSSVLPAFSVTSTRS